MGWGDRTTATPWGEEHNIKQKEESIPATQCSMNCSFNWQTVGTCIKAII